MPLRYCHWGNVIEKVISAVAFNNNGKVKRLSGVLVRSSTFFLALHIWLSWTLELSLNDEYATNFSISHVAQCFMFLPRIPFALLKYRGQQCLWVLCCCLQFTIWLRQDPDSENAARCWRKIALHWFFRLCHEDFEGRRTLQILHWISSILY